MILQSFVTLHTPTRHLWSSNDSSKLSIHRHCNSYGKRLPSATAADWWNGLPVILKKSSHDSFKKGLKTFLLNEHFKST